MFTKIVTVATEPSHQITLHYKTAESAHKAPEIPSNLIVFVDDFGQTATVATELLASHVIVDAAGNHAAGGEMHIAKLRAAETFSARVQGDDEVRALYEKMMPPAPEQPKEAA